MARPTTPNDTPENGVLNFRQNEEENLKDAWYRICNAQSRSTRGNFLGSHTVDSYRAIMNLVGSPPLMVNGTILTLEHVMQRLDAIENKIATVELIEGLDRKIHNQITQYGSKVGNFLKNLREKELIVNDSSRIGKLEDVITNLGSAFAAVQNTPNLTLKKTVKPVFVPKASGESSNKDEDLKMINDHATYGLSTKDDYT
ncbi:Far1 [Hordeum vulgare]|nr:Far1 [Hordeum vulgare]KAE8789989.1 Far1 [Hordeum vulgare]